MAPINHIAHFFAKHAPGFAYNPKKPISEFYRFSDTVEWWRKPRGGAARDATYQTFLRALTLQFNPRRANKDTSESMYAAPYHAIRMEHIRLFHDSFQTELSLRRIAKTPPLKAFFAAYADIFTYNPKEPPTDEFSRLRKTSEWKNKSKDDKQSQHEAFKTALTLQFNEDYGTDVNDLTSWQFIARRIGIVPVPDTIELCEEKFEASHVNLVDLVHARQTKGRVTRFESEVELSAYTKQSRKFFPRDNIHAGNLLKYLLRHIMNPCIGLCKQERGKRNGKGKGKAGKK